MAGNARSSSSSPRPVDSGGEHRLRSENLAFDIDVWYPPLADHTFHTVFLPLDRYDAEAIVAYYNCVHRHIKDGSFTDASVKRLRNLEARIEGILKNESSFKENGGAFLRLCGRSPKDGEPTDPDLRSKIWDRYCQELERVKAEQAPTSSEEDETLSGNSRIAAISHIPSTLRVTNGKEAMSLLLTSERVFSDMLDWLHYGEPEQIVLREFCDSFDLSTEFRCYIRPRGVLVGISQYDTYAKHMFLQDPEQRAIIVQAILKELAKVKDCIETIDGSYCVDFGVDMKEQKASLIELSPFRRCTGPALFAWKQQHDKAGAEILFPDRLDVLDDTIASLLTKGQNSEYERFIDKRAIFRVRSQAISGIGDLVEMNWDYRWSKDRVDAPRPFSEHYASALVTKPQATFLRQLRNWWFSNKEKVEQHQHILFVYGTLKRSCHWHDKYLTGAYFLGEGRTAQPQPLVIGACGVPYLLPTSSFSSSTDDNDDVQRPKNVRGELYGISTDMLRGMDEYEGIRKGHYTREEIDVEVVSGVAGSSRETTRIQKAFCYFYAVKPGVSTVDVSLLKAERIAEYTAEEQKERYKPIHHIQVKQLQYLGENSTT